MREESASEPQEREKMRKSFEILTFFVGGKFGVDADDDIVAGDGADTIKVVSSDNDAASDTDASPFLTSHATIIEILCRSKKKFL